MKIFLSWSGDQSREIANALYDWIPNILNNVEPWMSKFDIRAGKQWLAALSKELEGTHFGITCLTPTNLTEPWILFEAGALAKKVDEAYLCTYLAADVQIVDIAEPLRPFQSVHWDKPGTKKLLDTINEALEKGGRPQPKLDEAFELWWPKLEAKLLATKPDAPQPAKKVTLDDLAKALDELLQRSRSGAQLQPVVLLADPEDPALRNLLGHASAFEYWLPKYTFKSWLPRVRKGDSPVQKPSDDAGTPVDPSDSKND
jgi:hypothetical protein